MQARDDGLCPFCGTNVEGFPVCRGCNAEKFYAEKNTDHLVYDTIYFLILIPVLWYFRQPIISFLDDYLADYGEVPVYGMLGFCVLGLAFKLYDWKNQMPFTGYAWKKRLK